MYLAKLAHLARAKHLLRMPREYRRGKGKAAITHFLDLSNYRARRFDLRADSAVNTGARAIRGQRKLKINGQQYPFQLAINCEEVAVPRFASLPWPKENFPVVLEDSYPPSLHFILYLLCSTESFLLFLCSWGHVTVRAVCTCYCRCE